MEVVWSAAKDCSFITLCNLEIWNVYTDAELLRMISYSLIRVKEELKEVERQRREQKSRPSFLSEFNCDKPNGADSLDSPNQRW